METQDSFERMAAGISNEERINILSQMNSSEQESDGALSPANEKIEESNEPFEVRIKNESIFLRFIIWLKALLSNTKKEVIYNEFKLSEISRYIEKNFPGLIDAKQGLLLSAFYDKLTELKSCADFFKPYLVSTIDNEGSFYVFLSSLVMPEVNADITNNADPYSNPVTAEIRPDLRASLLRKMDDIFETIPAHDKAKMYTGAKATEWLRQFVRLPISRVLTQFTESENSHTCPYSQLDAEITEFAKVLCTSLEIPDEFLEGGIVLCFIKDVPIIVIRKGLICSLKSSKIKLTPRRIR